ncbi:MAG: hypothetical protein P4L64_09045 [Caulobacteraceae bacterium]|nr:hypothetical protein [Caulobacteraceae bacterium]
MSLLSASCGLGRRLATAVLASLTLSAPALAQTLGQGAATTIPWWRLGGALLLCILLAIGGGLALKLRLGGATSAFSRSSRRLQLVESLRLSHQIDICLLRCDDRDFMIAASPSGVTVLASGDGIGPRPAP